MRNWIILVLTFLFTSNLQAQLLERQIHRQMILNRGSSSGGGGGGFTQRQTQGNDTDNNGLSTTGGNQMLHSSFTASATYGISKATVRLRKTGSPTFNIVARIYTDSGGSGPTTPQIGSDSDASIAATTITGSFADYDFTWATPPNVSNGTRYWVALVASGVGDGSNFVAWSGNPSGTESQWRSEAPTLLNQVVVQTSMDGSMTLFSTP